MTTFREAAATLYGTETANLIYDSVEWTAEVAFRGEITAARPVILAPIEMGAYNRHDGWYGPRKGQAGVILVNRHHVGGSDWFNIKDVDSFRDVLIHEMTHAYQTEVVLKWNRPKFGRGPHRHESWFEAVSFAAPAVLGVELPRSVWPSRKSVRVGGSIQKENRVGHFTEVEFTHWPAGLRKAIDRAQPAP